MFNFRLHFQLFTSYRKKELCRNYDNDNTGTLGLKFLDLRPLLFLSNADNSKQFHIMSIASYLYEGSLISTK